MSDKKISDFTAAVSLNAADLFEIENSGGNSRKITASNAAASFVSFAAGTSFPGAPATGDRFWRTDRYIQYFYDGTRWLSTQLFILPIGAQAFVNPQTATSDFLVTNPHWSQYDVYVERGTVSSYNTATTASNYMTFQFKYRDATTLSNLGTSMSAQDDAQNTMVNHSVTPNVVVASTIEDFSITWAETGTASVFISAALQYRLVG